MKDCTAHANSRADLPELPMRATRVINSVTLLGNSDVKSPHVTMRGTS